MASIVKMTELQPLGQNQLTFITTDNCTAACPHCLMNCEPGQKHYLTFAQMKDAIDAFRAKEKLLLVIFTGGEPTLLGKDLTETIRYCTSLGVLTRVVTNAHWASTPERAEKTLKALREAGLSEINMSMDDYHAPYVPMENIRTAWNCIKGMGFQAAVIANCHGEGDTVTPEFIQEYLGEKISIRDADHRTVPGAEESFAADGTLYIIAEGRLQKLGRADEEIRKEDKYYQNEPAIYGGCSSVLSQPCVSFKRSVWACCGVCSEDNPILNLGSLNDHTFGEIIDRGADSVLINALHYFGPAGMWEVACAADPSLDTGKKYHSVCEYCEELTNNKRAMDLLRCNLPALAKVVRQRRKMLEEETNESRTANTDPQA